MDFALLVKSIVIGIVEGITEFLPISSTGHMVLVGSLIDFKGPFANLFEIFIQFGAILAVVVLYREKIVASFKALRPGEFGFRLWLGILVAFIPAAVVGLIFNKKIEKYLFRPLPIACSLLVGGILLLIAEHYYKNNRITAKPEDVTVKQGITIGIFQCLSLWPGFSRSASTIIGGWVVGMTTAAAAEFTFFLAIPTMFAASGYSLVKSGMALDFSQIVCLIVGFGVAFLVALVVVKKFIGYLKRKPLRIFAYYRILVGVAIIVLSLTKVVSV